MQNFLKTELGVQALKQRSLNLNARQRRLLLLIGTEDFKTLNTELKQKLANPEILQQLEALGLIFSTDKITTFLANSAIEVPRHKAQTALFEEYNLQPTDLKTSELTTQESQNLIGRETVHNKVPPSSSKLENDQDTLTIQLSFNAVQDLMIQLLQQYCGLMAKRLITQIEASENLRMLKLCQMQWITALQETKISPVDLNKSLQQINVSLQHLHATEFKSN